MLPKSSAPLVVEYHKEFTYFFDAYGINSLGSIEEKPGIPPSAGRIAEVASTAKAAGVRLAIAGEYAPPEDNGESLRTLRDTGPASRNLDSTARKGTGLH